MLVPRSVLLYLMFLLGSDIELISARKGANSWCKDVPRIWFLAVLGFFYVPEWNEHFQLPNSLVVVVLISELLGSEWSEDIFLCLLAVCLSHMSSHASLQTSSAPRSKETCRLGAFGTPRASPVRSVLGSVSWWNLTLPKTNIAPKNDGFE